MEEGNRMTWKNMDLVKTFLECCIQEVSKNGRLGGSLKPESWNNVRKVLDQTYKVSPSQKQMKNRYDYLKEKYQAWLSISQKTGNIFDPATNTIHWTNAEWDDYIKTHPKARSLKNAPLPFPDLCRALFDGAAATGVHGWGPSSVNVRPTTSLGNIGIEEILFANESDATPNHSNPSTPTSVHQPSSSTFIEERSRKRRRSSIGSSKLDEQMSSALNLIVEKNSGPSVGDCINKLNSLGWDKTSSLYMVAVGIFCESASIREAWMMLSEVETFEGWIKMIGTKLGFNM